MAEKEREDHQKEGGDKADLREILFLAFIGVSFLIGCVSFSFLLRADDRGRAHLDRIYERKIAIEAIENKAEFFGPRAGPELTIARINHILYGDQTGGGHLHSVGKPCKSEFPADWDKKEIIDTIRSLAANDNADWEQQGNGYYVSEFVEGQIRIRIVIDSKKESVITAYPVNVKRNPCPVPAAANDNTP